MFVNSGPLCNLSVVGKPPLHTYQQPNDLSFYLQLYLSLYLLLLYLLLLLFLTNVYAWLKEFVP